MPVKISKYTCQFRCGTRAIGSKANMLKHETYCVRNPINKSCSTCKNSQYFRDSDEYRSWHCRGCKFSAMNEFIENMHDFLEIESGAGHIKPLVNCPNWNLEKEHEDTKQYCIDVEKRIRQKAAEREGSKSELPF